MMSVALSITEGAVTSHVRIRASSLDRALKIAGYGDGRKMVSVTSPMPVTEILSMDQDEQLTPERSIASPANISGDRLALTV